MNEKIWIYTLSKELTSAQIEDVNLRCANFVLTWKAHDVQLDASYELYKNRLLIFKVNEASYNASGCSIDKQVRFVKELEQAFDIELLNRLLVAYELNSEICVTPQSTIKDLLKSNSMNENTLIFNNTISNSTDLENNWKQPLHQTWLSKYINS